MDPIAQESWDLPGGEWERLLLGTPRDVPSMDRAMHPWHEMVPAASRLRAGVSNVIGAGGDKQLP